MHTTSILETQKQDTLANMVFYHHISSSDLRILYVESKTCSWFTSHTKILILNKLLLRDTVENIIART